MNRSRRGWAVSAAAIVLGWAGGARGAGEPGVTTTGATIAAGAGSPQGAVEIEPCSETELPPELPPLPGLGTLGSVGGSLPAFGGAGSGGATFASSGALTTLAGGTYDFTSYTISAGHTVRYTGPVTIRTTGNVSIQGVLETLSASDAAITLRAGGSISVERQGNQTCIIGPAGTTSGALTLDAQGPIFFGGTDPASNRAATTQSNMTSVTIVSQDTATGISLNGANIGGFNHEIRIEAPRVSVNQTSMASGNFATTVRSRSDDLTLANSTFAANAALTVESGGGITMTDSGILSFLSNASLAAFGGDLALTNSTLGSVGFGATVDARASGAVTLDAFADVFNSSGSALSVTAFGGDIRLDTLGGASSSNINGTGANVFTTVAASGNVLVYADADVSGEGGLTVRAGGSVDARGSGLLRAGTGTLSLHAGESILVSSFMSSAFELVGGTLQAFAAGESLSRLELGFMLTTGSMSVLVQGPLDLAGFPRSFGPMSFVSIGGDIDASGASIETMDDFVDPTAPIEILTYAGCGACIDLTGAAVSTGDADLASGDIRIAIIEAPPVETDGSISMKSVKTKGDDERQSIAFKGVVNSGSAPALGAGDYVVTIGDTEHTFLVTSPKPGLLVAKDSAGSLKMKAPRGAGSAWKTSLKLSAAGESPLFRNSVSMRIEGGGISEPFDCVLEDGKFQFGKTGTVQLPPLAVLKALVKVAPNGSDAVTASFAFPPPSGPQAVATDLGISIGDVDVTIPAAAQTSTSPGVFVLSGSTDGVASLLLDTVRGVLTVGLSGDTGAPPAPGAPDVVVRCSVDLGDGNGPREIAFRMRVLAGGAKLKY